MNKLSSKFVIGISFILFGIISISLIINSFYVQRYYIHEKKQYISKISNQLKEGVLKNEAIEPLIQTLEKEEEVTIAYITYNDDIDQLNELLRTELQNKGIGFSKFWLWDEDYAKVLRDGEKIKIYNQGKLNYSLLVEYIKVDTNFFAVAVVIPDISDTISIINTCTVGIILIALVLADILIIFLIKRITKPLLEIKKLADDISNQHFYEIDVKTNDELETVAMSMNQMCREIQAYQEKLIQKNQQMEVLLDNVAHDLKTPISLIRAYTTGMRDGMDDGTFLEIIMKQNNVMNDMVESLLLLSRIKHSEVTIDTVDLEVLLRKVIEEQSILLRDTYLDFNVKLESKCIINSNREMVRNIMVNLISNAIKYSAGSTIDIRLYEEGNKYIFEITNEIASPNIDLKQIWMPFYVGEESRNKSLSGTGLGLSIVQAVVKKLGYECKCSLSESRICFQVIFSKNVK